MPLQDSYFYNQNITDYLNKSFAGNMIRYAPNGQAPLFALTSMIGEGKAKAVEHGYFSKTLLFPKVVVDGAHSNSDTQITVDDTSEVVPGELLRRASGEILRVASVVSSTVLTVARGFGQVSATSIADDEVIYSIGNAHEQASLRPISRLMNPVRLLNNTQIIRDSWALPGTLTALEPVVGNSLVAESRADCGHFHAGAIERALIFGQKSGRIVNQQYLTTMDGLVETVRRLAPVANTTNAGSTTTYAQLEAALNPVFNTMTDGRNGNERTLFVGGKAREVINGIGRLSGQYQIVDGQTNFGLQFSTFKTSRGMFRMIEHPQFNSNPVWSAMAIAVDIPSLRLMYLRKTTQIEYGMDGRATDNGIDAVGGTFTTELTMENINPSAHAVIHGLTAAAAPA